MKSTYPRGSKGRGRNRIDSVRTRSASDLVSKRQYVTTADGSVLTDGDLPVVDIGAVHGAAVPDVNSLEKESTTVRITV